MENEIGPGGERILVVDDAPQNVKLMRLILKDAGYQVIEAFSGQEALDKLHQEQPAAMLLDVRMPGMTGYEVCEKVRQDPVFATLPIIMVTALSIPEERLRGIEAGATDFITKPFNKKELLARLRSSLTLGKAERRDCMVELAVAVLIADPGWRILGVSAAAATLLGVAENSLKGESLAAVLNEQDKTAVMAVADSPESALLHLHPSAGQGELTGKYTPVSDASGGLVLRIIVLQGAHGSNEDDASIIHS